MSEVFLFNFIFPIFEAVKFSGKSWFEWGIYYSAHHIAKFLFYALCLRAIVWKTAKDSRTIQPDSKSVKENNNFKLVIYVEFVCQPGIKLSYCCVSRQMSPDHFQPHNFNRFLWSLNSKAQKTLKFYRICVPVAFVNGCWNFSSLQINVIFMY